jgi:hypothetical protein
VRRLVRHGLAGVGAATFAVVAGVTALGGPATSTLAVPAVTTVPQSVVAPVDPELDAQRAANAARENRDAERTRIAQSAVTAADQRAADLGSQSTTIDNASDAAKAARAKARAEAKARAKAKAAAEKKKREAAERKRKAAIKAQGYTPGTTDLRDMARQILSNRFGYGSDQYSCFSWIIDHESGWNPRATNPSSGAYGLPQSLPGSKMATVASDWRTNPATQIIWGAKYMKDRYGSPCAAKSFWLGNHHY